MLTAKEAHARSCDNSLVNLVIYLDGKVQTSIERGDFVACFDPGSWPPTVVGEAVRELREAGYEVTEDTNEVIIEW